MQSGWRRRRPSAGRSRRPAAAGPRGREEKAMSYNGHEGRGNTRHRQRLSHEGRGNTRHRQRLTDPSATNPTSPAATTCTDNRELTAVARARVSNFGPRPWAVLQRLLSTGMVCGGGGGWGGGAPETVETAGPRPTERGRPSQRLRRTQPAGRPGSEPPAPAGSRPGSAQPTGRGLTGPPPAAPPSRQRDCHFADTLSPSPSRRLIKGEGAAAK